MSLPERLMRRDTLLLLGANLVPALGVLLAGWDAFPLLFLYWAETVIILFWTVVGIATGPRAHERYSPMGLAGFTALHAGIFVYVHGFFLFILFSGAWSTRIDSPTEALFAFLVPTGVWFPLAAYFVVHGLLLLSARRAGQPEPGLGRLYSRILLMQVVIIGSGWLLMLTGQNLALLVLVALKTLLDLRPVIWPKQ